MNKQGRKFKNFKKRYDLLISEGFENKDLDIDLKKADEIEKLNMIQLENKFNAKLNEYTTLYKSYLEELLTRQQSSMSTLKNKVIMQNGQRYFVNDMNYKRRFTSEAWNSKSDTCSDPVSTNIQSNTFNELQNGKDMGIGEICRSGGYKAVSNGTEAWVDVFGVKHLWENPNDKHNSCKGSQISIGSTAFVAIPEGTIYTNNDKCSRNKLDSSKWEQIKNKNMELMDMVLQMNDQKNKFKDHDEVINNKVDEQKNKLTTIANNLNNKRKKLLNLQINLDSLDSQLENKKLNIGSINLKRIVWILAGLTVGFTILRQIKN